MTFQPRLLRKGDRVETADSAEEETNLLFDGWVDGGTPVPYVDPNRHITAGEVPTLPELKAAFGTPRELLGARFAFFGDSITGFGQRFPFYASIISRQRISYSDALTFSHAGYTSTQLAALTAEVTGISPAPHVVHVHAGANDAQAGVPVATYSANMKTIIDTFSKAGLTVVVGGVLPLASTAARPFVRQYNNWLRAYCAAEALTFVDFYPAMADRTTGAPAAGMIGGDGVHPTPLGQKTMGALLVSVLSPVLPPISPLLTADAADTSNLIVNGLALTDTDSNGVPDNWYPSGSTTGWTASLVDDGTAVGKWMRLVGSGTTGQYTYGGQSIFPPGFAGGDTLLVSCRVRTSGLTGAQAALWVQIQAFDSSNALLAYPYLVSGLSAPVDGVASARFTVPAGTAKLIPYYQVGGNGNGDGTYEVADFTAINLTALGIA